MTNKLKSSLLRVQLFRQKIDLAVHSGTRRHILILYIQRADAFRKGLTRPCWKNCFYFLHYVNQPPRCMACGTRNLRQDSHKPFNLFSVRQINHFLRYFLLGDSSLLGPQSETAGVHQLWVWLSAVNTSISLIKSPIKRILY